jgi:hypothetical protein
MESRWPRSFGGLRWLARSWTRGGLLRRVASRSSLRKGRRPDFCTPPVHFLRHLFGAGAEMGGPGPRKGRFCRGFETGTLPAT